MSVLRLTLFGLQCQEQVDLVCACGATRITVPCGAERHAKPPRCTQHCTLPPYCRHTSQHPHLCHDGPCPQCTQPCGQPMDGCRHACRAACHDARPPATPTAKARKRNVQAAQLTPVPTPCPPCSTPVERRCLGDHETRTAPCHMDAAFACIAPCARPLTACDCICQRPCHAPHSTPRLTWSALARADLKAPCQPCGKRCVKPRLPGCPHPCPSLCHKGDCKPCTQLQSRLCHCRGVTLQLECALLVSASAADLVEMLSCSVKCCKVLSCGHLCTLVT